MIVMTPLNGLGATLPVTSTQVLHQQRADVAVFRQMAGGARLAISPRGVGNVFGSVPVWVWAGGGGLALGLVAGAIYFRRKRRG